MEPVFKPLDWQREDILDTLNSLVQQHLPKLVVKTVLPLSIPLFLTALPESELEFNKLTTHCLENPVQFQDFSIDNCGIKCKFLFITNTAPHEIPVFKFQDTDAQTLKLEPMVKHLHNLVFIYSIPKTNISFHVQEPAYTFRWNSSYEMYVGNKGINYTEFINGLLPSETAPTSPQPGTSTSVLDQIAAEFTELQQQEVDDINIFKSPRLNIYETPPGIHSIRPRRPPVSYAQSRLAAMNIAAMKSSMEPLQVVFSTDHVYNMLQKDIRWENKDLAKLVMAVNGIISVQGPSDKSTQKSNTVGNTVHVEKSAVTEDVSDETEDS